MRINEIILEDTQLDELSALGAGQGIGRVGGNIVRGTKDFFSGIKQGYQQARNPAGGQPGTPATTPGTTPASGQSAPTASSGSAPTSGQTGAASSAGDFDSEFGVPVTAAGAQKFLNIPQQDRMKQISAAKAAGYTVDSKTGIYTPPSTTAGSQQSSTSQQSASGSTAPAPSSQAAPATINAPAVAPNVEAIKKAYTNLDTTERDKLKSELEIIDDHERLATGTNESLDDLLKLSGV